MNTPYQQINALPSNAPQGHFFQGAYQTCYLLPTTYYLTSIGAKR